VQNFDVDNDDVYMMDATEEKHKKVNFPLFLSFIGGAIADYQAVRGFMCSPASLGTFAYHFSCDFTRGGFMRNK
jgi:hypothetical protein